MTMLAMTLFSVGSLLVVLQNAYVVMSTPDFTFVEGPKGPSNWYLIDVANNTCGGKNQSPIDIQTQIETSPDHNLRFYNYDSYQAESIILKNDGHMGRVDFTYGSTTDLDYVPYITGAQLKDRYKLINIHFHWGSDSTKGSEHTFDGKKYPLEGNLVHIKMEHKNLTEAEKDKYGIAFVGFMYEITEYDNPHLTKLLSSYQDIRYKGQTENLEHFNIYDLLPQNYEYYYSYYGSLSAPPCSELASWNYLAKVAGISEAQMEIFRNLQTETEANDPNNDMPLVNNFRPIQPLNGREVSKGRIIN